MQKIVYDLKDEKEEFGKKGNNLRRLYNLFVDDKDIIIPETLVLSESLFKRIVTGNGNHEYENYENIYIDPTITKEIIDTINKNFGESKLVIRSSATCEDSIFFSGSGQYDSFLNISGEQQIMTAIKKVYSSFFSKNSKLYSKIYDIDLKGECMLVLVQKVAPVVQSGVMFSCNPVDGTQKYIIESASGLGTNVVSGVGNIQHIEIEKNDATCSNEITTKLITCLEKIKKEFGYEVDVEWGIDNDKNIYIFQARPIILQYQDMKVNYESKEQNNKCVSISKGFNIGRISNISDLKIGTILYQNESYDFNDLSVLLRAKGVILNKDSRLSHFANILRELRKPCVFIEDFSFNKEDLYLIDGYNSNLINFSNLDSHSKATLMYDLFNHMKETYKDSFERYNGITGIIEDDKIEQVVFDIEENKVLELLKENGFKEKTFTQGIYTYDFKDNSLINENIIFRIQTVENAVRIQFKQIDCSNEYYRKEKGILLNFDLLNRAKQFMKDLNMNETGYQERKIISYVKDDIVINVIKWPNCKPYLGIEASKIQDLERIKKMLDLENCMATGMGGKEIFKKLNLTLKNCRF